MWVEKQQLNSLTFVISDKLGRVTPSRVKNIEQSKYKVAKIQRMVIQALTGSSCTLRKNNVVSLTLNIFVYLLAFYSSLKFFKFVSYKIVRFVLFF